MTTTNVQGATGEHHVIKNDGTNIFLDNKMISNVVSLPVPKDSKFATNAAASPSDTIWYVKDYVQGSVNTTYSDLTTLYGIIIGAINPIAGVAWTIATWFFGHNLPYLWFTKLTLWDQAQYHPTYWISIETYSDARMTIHETSDSYYL